MAITIQTQPDYLHMAFNDVEWAVKSDRNERNAFSVTGVTDSSGKCRFAVSSDPTAAPAIQVGDTILGSGFTTTQYNVLQNVTAVNAAYIETDLDFYADDTGTMTRRNDNFKVKASLQLKSSAWTAATQAVSGGYAQVTSAVITEADVLPGDYIFVYTTYLGNKVWSLHKVTSVSGNTATTTTTSALLGIQTCALTTNIGTLYQQSEEVDADSLFTFEVSRIINAHLDIDIFTIGETNIQTSTSKEAMQMYAVVFDELYEDKNGLYKVSTTPTRSDGKLALNGCNQDNQTQSTARFVLDGTSKEFLTDAANITLHINQEFQLSFITDETSVKLAYRKYNLSGTPAAWTALGAVTMQDAREDYYKGTAILSKTTVFDASTSRVDVKLQTAAGTDISETLTFYIDQTCYDSNVVLEFKNRYGGVDSFNYVVIGESRVNVDRQYYKNAGTKGTSHVMSSKVLTLESRYEKKSTFEWLQQLYESDEIYMIDTSYTAKRVRVNLTESDYIVTSQDLFNSIIEVELQEARLNG